MKEHIADGMLLGTFGFVCIVAGDAVHKRDWLTIGCCLALMAVMAQLILRSMAADHFKEI